MPQKDFLFLFISPQYDTFSKPNCQNINLKDENP
jgi:hypothetical protein